MIFYYINFNWYRYKCNYYNEAMSEHIIIYHVKNYVYNSKIKPNYID